MILTMHLIGVIMVQAPAETSKSTTSLFCTTATMPRVAYQTQITHLHLNESDHIPTWLLADGFRHLQLSALGGTLLLQPTEPEKAKSSCDSMSFCKSFLARSERRSFMISPSRETVAEAMISCHIQWVKVTQQNTLAILAPIRK
jgi:hypothetical protein